MKTNNQLPSDEEIAKQATERYYEHRDKILCLGFEHGATWMRQQAEDLINKLFITNGKSQKGQTMKSLTFLKAFNSPFKRPKFKWYCGKIAIGTPYFFPRKWVKATPELTHKATLDYIKAEELFNEMNPKYTRKIKSYDEIYKDKLTYTYPIPKKIGFDFVSLGWKTKWTDTDYRFEWAPLLSFVFFGYQIAVTVIAPEQTHYWEAWLYYERNTDKTKSKKERIEQCMKEFPQMWTIYNKKPTEYKETVNKYNNILKDKYKPIK